MGRFDEFNPLEVNVRSAVLIRLVVGGAQDAIILRALPRIASYLPKPCLP